jgi:hypothetical protein
LSSKGQSLTSTQSGKFQATYDPIDVTRRLFDLLCYRRGMMMRLCWQSFTVAIVFFAIPAAAEPSSGSRLLQHVQNFKEYPATAKAGHAVGLVTPVQPLSDSMSDELETFTPPVVFVSDETKRREPDSIIFVSMSGKCNTLKVAGRDFGCRAVAFFQTEQGRANFAIVLDDPADNSHIVTFSGENARKEQDNLYELSVDRMLLKSKDRPKADGLPVPLVESSTGSCKQIGNFATSPVSSVSCTAINTNGKKYELQFETDGAPIRVMRLREYPVPTEKRRAKQIEQFECRLKADVAKVLPRDRTAYIIGCLEDDNQQPTTAGPQ